MQNLYSTALAGKQEQRAAAAEEQNAQLRGLQYQQAQQQYKASVGDAVLKDRAVKTAPPTADAGADAWMRWGRTQEQGGYSASAKMAYEYAQSLQAPEQYPDYYSSLPEMSKLQYERRKALTENRLTEAQELSDRITKLKDKAVTQPARARLESSKQSAANISTVLSTVAGITLEGDEALALGDLSRSLTDRIPQKYGVEVTQSEVNDAISAAYVQIMEERKEALGTVWGGITGTLFGDAGRVEAGPSADWVPFVDAEPPSKFDIEARVIDMLEQRKAQAQGRGTETVTVTEDEEDEALFNQYLP